MKRIYIFSLLISLLMLPAIAGAESEGVLKNNEIGFSIFTGYAMLGEDIPIRQTGANIIYHPVSFIAFEPAGYFSNRKEDEKNNTSGHTTTTKENRKGYVLSIYYYHNINNNLYLYIGPRFEYKKDISDETNDYDSYRTKYQTDYLNYYLPVGLKYMINDNIGIFCDFSFGYGKTEENEKRWSSAGALTTDKTTKTDVKDLMSTTLGITFYL